MIQEFNRFRKDLVEANPAFNLWGPILNIPLISGVFFFPNYPLSWLISLSTVLATWIAIKIHGRLPLSRLTGVCHGVWLPIYPFIVYGVFDDSLTFSLRVWLAWCSCLMGISLFFDGRDFYKYVFTEDKTFIRKT